MPIGKLKFVKEYRESVLSLGLGCSVLVVAPVGVGSAWFGALASCFRCVGSAPCGGSVWLASSVPFPAPPVGGQLSLF